MSLLSVDYKILTNVIGTRIEKVNVNKLRSNMQVMLKVATLVKM